MIYLLIYPYCDFGWIREIEAVEKEPGQRPLLSASTVDAGAIKLYS